VTTERRPFRLAADTWNSRRLHWEGYNMSRSRTDIAYRDERGKHRQLAVGINNDRVVLTPHDGNAIALTPLQAGRLRAALRDVVLDGR
jgi:hypothetical protein